MKIRHYKELGDLDLQWSEPLNLAVFESSVVAIFSGAMFLFVRQKVSFSFSPRTSNSLTWIFSQQKVQNTLIEQNGSIRLKVKFLSCAHQHEPCGFTRVPVCALQHEYFQSKLQRHQHGPCGFTRVPVLTLCFSSLSFPFLTNNMGRVVAHGGPC